MERGQDIWFRGVAFPFRPQSKVHADAGPGDSAMGDVGVATFGFSGWETGTEVPYIGYRLG